MKQRSTEGVVVYWVSVPAGKNAQTGEEMTREVGPFPVTVLGSVYNGGVTREQAVEYCRKNHGMDPVRVENLVTSCNVL